MNYRLFASASIETNLIPAGKLPAFIDSYKHEFQTGVLEVDFQNYSGHYLLFARGELVNVYRYAGAVERLDPTTWFQSIDTSKGKAYLRALALTPQAVRLVKILLEQNADAFLPLPPETLLEEQFRYWQQEPLPALAHLRWPHAEALALLPGQGSPPHYTLFISENQILHSAGGMMALYGWKEPCSATRLLSSQAHTPAWDEYMLYHSFGFMTGRLLERMVELTGPTLVQNIAREINFAAAAHGWSITLNGMNVTDQTIFSSPLEAADVYSRLLEILLRHMDITLGADLLAVLMREAALHLSKPYRSILQEYLLITPV
ncbi:MAG: hypothetical protein N2117_04020 [Anaerolineales bacterium]|nr:hypothetical protein [Anaerolineales bacterium]MCX7754397.1 hypothetical protein [Anaerolineales bacterium]MDW8277919.1 hypothetical protein [Anaerolineales bacterium]